MVGLHRLQLARREDLALLKERIPMLRNGHAIILALAAILACESAPERAEPQAPADPQVKAFEHASERLVGMLDSHGFLVSWWEGGTPAHEGDSLLWSSMAMGVLPCEKAEGVEAALLKMVQDLGGGLHRHPSLPAAVSLDGALGFWWGVAHRVARCPEAKALWVEAFGEHVAFTAARRLNPSSDVEFIAPFLAVRNAVGSMLGLTEAPSASEIDGLAKLLAGWAFTVKTQHAAAYRIHLGLLSLQAVEASGVSVPSSGRDAYCAATEGVDMPTVDDWCGRGDLAAWAAAFQFDAWEYRFQRAKWESPDGKPGLHTPGLDYIVAMRALYNPLPFTSF